MNSLYKGYARSQGIRLLERAVQEIGPLFTRAEIQPLATQQGIPLARLSNLISALKTSGHIAILKRGVYLVQSPLFAGEVHPFAVAALLVQPVANSHWSALSHHGFTSQIPSIIQASTPRKVVTPEMRKGHANRPRGRAVWRVLDWEIEYIHIASQRFFGHQRIWVDSWHQVEITDRERTALDLITRPDIFGGMRSAIELLESALPQLDISQLVSYTLQYDMGAVIKRMGWILEHLGIQKMNITPLITYPATNYYRLDPQGPSAGTLNRLWHIIDNI
jgi:predicted transcriptional regulator of viral defense system